MKKKRTDRSYLQPSAAPEPEAQVALEAELASAGLVPEAAAADTPAAAVFVPPPAPAPPPVARTATLAPAASKPAYGGTARALQQQGVRKRREVDLTAVARRDSTYAIHELRRIAILAALVVIVLVVLALTMR